VAIESGVWLELMGVRRGDLPGGPGLHRASWIGQNWEDSNIIDTSVYSTAPEAQMRLK